MPNDRNFTKKLLCIKNVCAAKLYRLLKFNFLNELWQFKHSFDAKKSSLQYKAAYLFAN